MSPVLPLTAPTRRVGAAGPKVRGSRRCSDLCWGWIYARSHIAISQSDYGGIGWCFLYVERSGWWTVCLSQMGTCCYLADNSGHTVSVAVVHFRAFASICFCIAFLTWNRCSLHVKSWRPVFILLKEMNIIVMAESLYRRMIQSQYLKMSFSVQLVLF